MKGIPLRRQLRDGWGKILKCIENILLEMRLVDFYTQARDANRAQAAGWSTLYYGVFSSVVKENNYKNIAEILI